MLPSVGESLKFFGLHRVIGEYTFVHPYVRGDPPSGKHGRGHEWSRESRTHPSAWAKPPQFSLRTSHSIGDSLPNSGSTVTIYPIATLNLRTYVLLHI